MLSGQFYFRQVYFIPDQTYAELDEAVTLYGTMTFDGNGNYTAAVTGLDYSQSAGAESGSFTATGTYAIAASGYGFISSPYATNDFVVGLVSANGVFVGSSTDNAYAYNDMFVAAKIASPAPTGSTLSGSWTGAVVDFSGLEEESALGYVFTMSPDANGNLNLQSVTGYSGESAQVYTQTNSGLKYTFSSGAAVATFPAAGSSSAELMSGQKYFYFSPDGNFMFGGSPIASDTPFDFIVAVKNTSTAPLSGLYYQAGIDINSYTEDLDTYFGSFTMSTGGIELGHQRVNDYGGDSVYDYTYDGTLTLQGTALNNGATKFIAGAGGAELITSGISPGLGLSISLKAPSPTGTGVFLNPQGVVNAASYSPFTAGIAPGELLDLYGSNLAPSFAQAQGAFPTTGLNGVTVTIGGYPAALYFVSAGQISATVPYEVSADVGDIVDIQVNNNGQMSNIVTNYVANTAPGVFTQNQSGTGYGLIQHYSGDSAATQYSLVSDGSPAIEGETLVSYLTGLGTLGTSIADGAPGPGSGDATSNTISIDFSGVAGTNDYSGLAPGFSGLYQLNFTLPTTGITTFGPNYFDIAGPDAYMSYELIPIQASASSTTAAGEAQAHIALPARLHRPKTALPSLRNRAVKMPFPHLSFTSKE